MILSPSIPEVLNKCADQFENQPETWTQGMNASDETGYELPVNDPDACMWCLVGIVARELDCRTYVDENGEMVSFHPYMREYLRPLAYGIDNSPIEINDPETYVINWNDENDRTVPDVIDLLRSVANHMETS